MMSWKTNEKEELMAYRINNDKPTPVSKTTAYSQDQQNNQLEHTAPLPEFYEDKPKTSAGKKIAKVLFTLVLLILTGVSVGFAFLPKLNTVEVPEEIGIIKKEEINLTEEETEKYIEQVEGVMNILLIGVDEDGYDSGRSDVLMIMSIDKVSKKIHLTSVQRDTMAYIPLRGTYEKINHAYSYDQAVGTMTAINQNYDMDIEDFVVFDFAALRSMIDSIGGVVVYVDDNEYYDMSVSQQPAPGTGEQLLNGAQAEIYARVRYNSGGDQGRNERQREILKYIFHKAKDLSLGQLTDLAVNLLPKIRTSYNYGGMISMLEYFQTIKAGAELVEHSFPFEQTGVMYDSLSYVIPNTVTSNITQLHKELFNFDNYTPSDRAKGYSQHIGQITGVYVE